MEKRNKKICDKIYGFDTKITNSALARRIATARRLATNSGVPETKEPLSASDTTSVKYVSQKQRNTPEINLANRMSLAESINKTLVSCLFN